jgi:hypothetical protein
MARWLLWLDDQANDIDTPNRHPPQGYTAATSSHDAIALVLAKGTPEFMDLDHDLGMLNDGTVDDALRFLTWLQEHAPEPIRYRVHSQNPIGAQRIHAFMKSWRRWWLSQIS